MFRPKNHFEIVLLRLIRLFNLMMSRPYVCPYNEALHLHKITKNNRFDRSSGVRYNQFVLHILYLMLRTIDSNNKRQKKNKRFAL